MSNKLISAGGKNTSIEEDVTFSFHRPFWVGIWLVLMLSAGIFFAVVEAENGEYGGSLFFILGFAFFVYLGVYSTAGVSDICLSKKGISRKIFGKSWQIILWDNVRLISLREWSDVNTREKSKHVAIFPALKQKIRLFPSGKIAFSDKMENSREFIDLLNEYIRRHHIRIESYLDGRKSFPDYLLLSSRIQNGATSQGDFISIFQFKLAEIIKRRSSIFARKDVGDNSCRD